MAYTASKSMVLRASVYVVAFATFCAVGTAGIITTIAGTGARGFSGDEGPASSAQLSLANLQNPCDPVRFEQTARVFVDPKGNIYLPDSENQRIRRISPAGVITTVAGNGERPAVNAQCEPTSPNGDGGQALQARLYNPSDVVALADGSLIIADQQNNRIRQVSPSGAISALVGSGLHNLYAPGVPALNSPMDWPASVAVDPAGALYFAEIHGNRVAKVGSDGRLVTIAGTGFPGSSGDGASATSARLNKPAGIAFDAGGTLYIADSGNHRIRKVSPDGVITTIAGTGGAEFSGDGGPAINAALNTPMDVRADGHGNIYIADTLNHRVRRIDAQGVITTVAGTGEPGRGADHVEAAGSALNHPSGIATDANGDLYIVDWQNYLVRKVTFGASISIEGVVNNASFTSSFGPGSLIAIFGSQLAVTEAVAAEGPWPTSLAGTQVLVNDAPIPLFVAFPGQVNAQLPFSIPVGSASLRVLTPAGSSPAVELQIAPAGPSIFMYPGTRRAIAVNQDGSFNSPENPETRGRAVTVFLTGVARFEPQVPAGALNPSEVLSWATQPSSARIGAAGADIIFLGLTPGSVGVAQANLIVPAEAVEGEAELSLQVDGESSNVVTVSVR